MTSILLFLKKISFDDIVEKYKSGYYFKSYKINNNVKKIKTIDNKIIYSSNQNDDIFFSSDKNGNKQIMATSNCKNVKMFREKGELLKYGRCEYCLQDYDTGTIGYPIKYEEKEYIDQNKKINIIYIFYVEGSFDSFECCLAYIQSCNDHNSSEELLRLLFKLLYPKKGKLIPAQNRRLIKENGGSIEYKDWKNNTNPFKKTNRIILVPVKEEFIRNSLFDFNELIK